MVLGIAVTESGIFMMKTGVRRVWTRAFRAHMTGMRCQIIIDHKPDGYVSVVLLLSWPRIEAKYPQSSQPPNALTSIFSTSGTAIPAKEQIYAGSSGLFGRY